MRYYKDELEQQIIDELTAKIQVPGVQIKTHAGEVSRELFLNPALQEGFIAKLPFIFIQYQGRSVDSSDDPYTSIRHEIVFRFYVGAKSLRTGREAQIGCYRILDEIWDILAGRYFGAVPIVTSLRTLEGFTIDAATNETPVQISANLKTMIDGQKVFVKNALGNTTINNTTEIPYWTLQKIDDTQGVLLGTEGNGDYTGDGTIISALTSTETNELDFIRAKPGENENLLVNEPQFKVYSLDYSVIFIA